MKITVLTITLLLLCSVFTVTISAQYKWRLSRNENGIKVFESPTKTSGLKAVRVECVINGTFDKLIALLRDVSRHNEWVYNCKAARLLKRNTANDFYYYSETVMPWPFSNRDAIVHLVMRRDSLDRNLRITATGVPNYIAEKSGLVRVKRYLANWYVTVPSPGKLSIIYTIEADPGGNVPTWLTNEFVDKGPFESFKKLGEILKK